MRILLISKDTDQYTNWFPQGLAYAFNRECLLNQKTRKGKKTSAVIIKETVVNIDTEYDFILAEFILDKIK